MFEIDASGNIRLSKGDTASFTVAATGYTFGSGDCALFTVKSGSGDVIFQHTYSLTGDSASGLANGEFRVELQNGDTDQLAVGSYQYDVRYAIDAVFDSSGKLVDGNEIITPKEAGTITLLTVVGDI